MYKTLIFLIAILNFASYSQAQNRSRAREFGIEPGILTPGHWNAITDVKGVTVGQATLVEGDSIRTGVTMIIPHQGNIFQEKVPAAVFVGNGFGKALGFTQIEELGNIETPIALTSTLNVFLVANALIDYTLSIPENSGVRSVNPVVGETNDGWLNDNVERSVKSKHVFQAISSAKTGSVEEGNVGAGTGTRCLGFKGGIGTSSRVLPKEKGGYTVGVLVQTNFGGILTINGAPVGKELNNFYMAEDVPYVVDGSCMIIIATDAPLSARNLKRLAKRSFLAFGKVGSFSSNGSGDYSIAFSAHPALRISYGANEIEKSVPEVANDHMSPLFLATVEATEEAIYNSLFMAKDITGQKGRTMKALPIEKTLKILDKYNAREDSPSEIVDSYIYLQKDGREKENWQIIWQDNFDDPEPDASKWTRIPPNAADWGKHMTSDSQCYTIADGKLFLKGIVNPDTSKDPRPFLTGGIYTKEKFAFQYGKIEIRAKLECAQGAWPAMWMLAEQKKYGAYPKNGEIDIMEHLNFENIIYQTTHSYYTLKLKQKNNPPHHETAKIDIAKFNTFGLEWYPDKLVFTLNGKETFTYPKVENVDPSQWPYDQPFYILIDQQLGGSWVGKIKPDDLPVQMIIDWVKVYQ